MIFYKNAGTSLHIIWTMDLPGIIDGYTPLPYTKHFYRDYGSGSYAPVRHYDDPSKVGDYTGEVCFKRCPVCPETPTCPECPTCPVRTAIPHVINAGILVILGLGGTWVVYRLCVKHNAGSRIRAFLRRFRASR